MLKPKVLLSILGESLLKKSPEEDLSRRVVIVT